MNGAPDILCIGAMLWDIIGRAPVPITPGDDRPGQIIRRPGGVALNVAMALARRGLSPAVLSAVGRDPEGEALMARAAAAGVLTDWLTRDTGLPTGSYLAIEDTSSLIAAIADARGLEQAGTRILKPLERQFRNWSGPIVIDGNLTETLLRQIARDPRLAQSDLRLVPASAGKAARIAPLITAPRGCLYLNRQEAEILAGQPCPDAASAAEALLARGAARVIVTDGPRPVAEARAGAPTLTITPPCVSVARITGAGDCLLAAHIAADLAHAPRELALRHAVEAAAMHVAGRDRG